MVENIAVEIFHQEPNFVVLRVPGRAYPGVVIQGDSLMGIVGELKEAIDVFESDREESLGCLENASEELKSRLDQYFEVCQRNGIR